MSQFTTSKSSPGGFTLIEILVTLAIMVTVLGLGIAGFIRFNERQQVKAFAKKIQTMLHTAQAKAQIREIDAENECEGPAYYAVFEYEITGGIQVISFLLQCDDAYIQYEDVKVPNGLVVEGLSNGVNFRMLSGEAVLDGSPATTQMEVTVRTTDSSTRFQFTVTSGGSISDGEFL